jgi:hypothetical protein
MKEKKPQFLRMNAFREENPPHREVGCPDYRRCLTEAAFRNFCLDCSLCAGAPESGAAQPECRLARAKTSFRAPGLLTAAG